MDLNERVEEYLAQFKAALMRKSPLLAFMLESMRHEYVNEDHPAVVRVRGKKLVIYRNAIDDAQKFAVAAVKAILHGAMAHPYRIVRLRRRYGTGIKKLDYGVTEIARMASDIVVFRLIPERMRKNYPLFTISFQALSRILGEDWDKCSMEQIFQKLLDLDEKMFMGLSESWEPDEAIDVRGTEEDMKCQGDEDLDKEIDEQEKNLADTVVKTSMFVGAGTESSDELRVLVERLLKDKPLPWHVILRRFLNGWEKRQHIASWRKLNRKSEDLPGYEQISRPRVIFAVDVSASISDEEYSIFCKEILAVSRATEIHLICWDTNSKYYGIVRSENDLKKKAKEVEGYGGTKISSIEKALKELRPKVNSGDLLIIMTDGYWYENDDEAYSFIRQIKCPKILLTTGQEKAGFDLTLKLKDKGEWA